MSSPVLILALLVAVSGASTRFEERGEEEEEPQVTAAREVIRRILGPRAAGPLDGAFALELMSLPARTSRSSLPAPDIFEVSTTAAAASTTIVRLRGTSGVALASAFYYYLRHFANGTVTWGANRSGIQLGALAAPRPQPLPKVPGGAVIRVDAGKSAIKYIFNFCTLSYSLAFADAAAWRFQVDWLALHGINAPLAAMGTEHVQALAYGPTGLGLTEEELEDFFPGPAFLGWNRMSDMDGPWSGPLTADWRARRAAVANRTYADMRALGMTPVLMGWGGHVPCQLRRVMPRLRLAPRQHWQGFNSSCLVDPQDPAFPKLAAAFMAAQRDAFGDWGVGGLYATDQWNEISPSRFDAPYLHNMSAAVFNAMEAFDPQATWVMQGWFLVSIALCRQGQTGYCGNPWLANTTTDSQPAQVQGVEGEGSSPLLPYPRAAAYLSGVPRGRLLILDLEANIYPVYKYTQGFYGHDFVWCVIHNFGEKTGMFGDLEALAAGPQAAAVAAPDNFRGVGLAMEGINNNPVVYELAAEMGWRVPGRPVADLDAWVGQYVVSRYGVGWQQLPPAPGVGAAAAQEAWKAMLDRRAGGVYTSWFDTSAVGVINGDASLRFVNASAPLPPLAPPGHNATHEANVARLLLAAAVAGEGEPPSTLRYDLVDSTRQCLDNLLWDTARVLEGAYRRESTPTLALAADHDHTAHHHRHRANHGNMGAPRPALRSSEHPGAVGAPAVTVASGLAACESPALAPPGRHATATIAGAWKQLALTLDAVLSTDSRFMLGPWIAAARSTAANDKNAPSKESDVLEYNARNQVTLWGPRSASLADYARKQWGGLVRSYHLRGRWGIRIDQALAQPGPFSAAAADRATRDFELAWQTNYSETFATEPQGESVAIATAAMAAFFPDCGAAAALVGVAGAAVGPCAAFGAPRPNVDTVGAAAANRTKDVWALLPDGQATWTRDVGSLAFLCTADPGCAGFSWPAGELKARVAGDGSGETFDPRRDVEPRPGVMLYVKVNAH